MTDPNRMSTATARFSRVFRQIEGLSPRQFKDMGGKRMPNSLHSAGPA